MLVQPGAASPQQGVNDTESYRLAIFPSGARRGRRRSERCRARAAASSFGLVPARALAAAARGDG